MKKRYLLIGCAAIFLCMIADWLLDVKGAGNITTGVVESNWTQMSMWRFEASIIIIAVIMPFYWLGIREADKIIRESCVQSCKADTRMSRLFSISTSAGLISFLFIHIMCCLMPIIYKCLIDLVPDTVTLTNTVNHISLYILVPFYAYFVAADLGISISFAYFVWKGRLNLPRAAALCTPVFTTFIALLFYITPFVILRDICVAFESMGYALILWCVYRHCVNGESKGQNSDLRHRSISQSS